MFYKTRLSFLKSIYEIIKRDNSNESHSRSSLCDHCHKRPVLTPTASNEAANHHVHAASAAAHAAVQTAENHQEQPLDTNITNLVSKVADEVEVATTKLNLATDSNRFFDEGIYSND